MEQREGPPLPGQAGAGAAAGGGDEAHQLVRQLHRLVGIIRDAQIQQHIRPPHDAQADFPGLLGGEIDLRQGVLVGVDDIVQEMDRSADGVRQLIPVDGVSAVPALLNHLHQVDGPQVAAFIGQKRLLAAGIGGFDLPLSGNHVVSVEAV